MKSHLHQFYISFAWIVVTSQDIPSNGSLHQIVEYIRANFNLENADLLIIFGENALINFSTDVVNEMSKNGLGVFAIGTYNLQNLRIQQSSQLIVCHSVLADAMHNFHDWVRPFVDVRFLPWVHKILHISSNLRLSQLVEFSENSSAHFQIHNKLRIIFSNVENSFKSSVYEMYSFNNVSFLEQMSKVVVRSHTFPNGTKYNFNGAVIRATAVDDPLNYPVVTYNKSSTTPQFIRGLGVFDFWDIRDMLNFTVLPMKGEEMSVNKSNNFLPVGIGQQLYDGEADVSILHSYHLLDNVRYLKPLVAMGADRVYAIFRQPPSFIVRNSFTKPFTTEAWVLIASTWGMIIIAVFTFVRVLEQFQFNESILTKMNKIDATNKRNEWQWNLTEIVLWTIAAFCQRSFFQIPIYTSLRVLVLNALLWSLAVYSLYSAHIISSFTAEFLPIRTLQDLIEYNFQLLSDPEQFYSDFLLPGTISPEAKKNYKNELAITFESELDSVRQLSSGLKMHFNTLDSLHLYSKQLNYSDKKTCELFHCIKLGTLSLTSGFYVKKNSPLQEPFNLKLIGIMERGLNRRYIRSYYEETIIKCPKAVTRYREDLGLSDVFSGFVIIIGGCVLSFIALFLEIFARTRCRKIRSKFPIKYRN